jgi:hypothetical protein
MPLCRTVLALLLFAAASRGADLTTLKGDVVKGDVVSLSDTELVLDKGGAKVTFPILQVVQLDYKEVGKPPAGLSYADVELTDGSVLHCTKWGIKGKQVEVTLISGRALKVPLAVVANVLAQAHVEKNRADWRTRLAAKRRQDVLVVAPAGGIQSIPCKFGEGDEAGTSIELSVELGGKVITRKRELATVHGLIFQRAHDPKMPPVVFKLLDTVNDVVMVSSVASKEGALTVTTPCGARLEFGPETLARLDYRKGKLDYLSELEPAKLLTRSNVEDGEKAEQQHVYKDASLKGERTPITVGGKAYPRGLAIRPYTELEYDLKGEYREFAAVAGLDDNVGADGATVLVVEGDGKELATVTISSDDKTRHKELKLNVKDVQRLRIIVKSGSLLDLGKHMDLADARVSK